MAQATIQVFVGEEGREKGQQQPIMPSKLGKGPRDILQALSVFPYFTAEQLSRYLDLNLRYTQDNLKLLADNKFVLPLTPTKQLHAGSVPYVYTLGAKGRKYVLVEGLEDLLETRTGDNGEYKTRFRPSEERKKTTKLLHSIAISEVLLQAKLLTRTNTEITLSGYVKERGFETDPLRVSINKEEKTRTVSLSPDLWLDFDRGEDRFCLCVEVNLTPVEQKRWRQKISAYLNSAKEYQKRFNTDILAVVTFIESPINFPKAKRGKLTSFEKTRFKDQERAREKRLTDMLRWTEKELRAKNALGAAESFLFTTADLNTSTPGDIFCKPQFLTPFSQVFESLIPPTEEAESG